MQLLNRDKQINMEGGQSGTYLRLTRASSGLRVSVAKTYRDEGGQSGTYLRLMRASAGLRVSVAKTYRDEKKRK